MVKNLLRHTDAGIIRLSIPMMLVGFCQIGIGSMDTLFSGRYSTVDLAGVSLGTMLWIPSMLFVNGVVSVLTPIASGYNANNNTVSEQQAFHVALTVSFLLGLFFTLLFYFALPVTTLYFDQDYLIIMGEYLRWVSPTLLFSALMQAVKSKLEAKSNTVLCLFATVVIFFVNLPLNYFLVNGSIFNSPMGGPGCGLATTITFFIGLIFLVLLTHYYYPTAACKDPTKSSSRPVSIGHFIRMGIPVGLTAYSEIGMFSILAILMVPYGTHVLGGHQIVMSITSLVFVLPMAIGSAATIMISKELALGNSTEANEVGKSALKLSMVCISFTALLLFIFSNELVSFYSKDPAVLTVALPLLFISVSSQWFDAGQTVLTGILKAHMDTMVPFVIMATGSWLVALPMGLLLSHFMEALNIPNPYIGYYISLWISLLLISLLLCLRYRYINRK